MDIQLFTVSHLVEEHQKDLRSLSAAIMAATERAELVAHETDRWLSGHQEFDKLEVVHGLVSEAEVGG